MKQFIVVLLLFLVSCQEKTSSSSLQGYLAHKIKTIESSVEQGGNLVGDVLLKDELLKTLMLVDQKGILSKMDINSLTLPNDDKESLSVLSDTIKSTSLEEYKLHLIDLYQQEISSRRVCFDKLKAIAVQRSENELDIYLTANTSYYLPAIYYSVGNKAHKLKNENREVNPTSFTLDDLQFDERFQPIEAEKDVLGYYMIPTSSGDLQLPIKTEDVIQLHK